MIPPLPPTPPTPPIPPNPPSPGVAKIPQSGWVTIAPRLSETSPDIIIVDLNEAGIKNELNRPQSSDSPSTLYLELSALYNANPSHKIVIKVGKPFLYFNEILGSVYGIGRESQWKIKPVLCELSADREYLIKKTHRTGDRVEIYPDEASAVEALKDR